MNEPARLLVVDDQSINRTLYRRALTQDGADVAEADSGETALEYLENHRVDLVLMDIMMGGMSGFDVAREIHDRYGDDGPPIVFVTAYDPSETDKARAFALGGVDFFYKPTDLAVLRRKVGGLVRLHRQKLEAAEHLERLRQERTEIAAMLQAARDIMSIGDFPTVARRIFDSCRDLIGAQAGYVALLSADGMENELLFLEAGGLPCSVKPDLPMPIRGLREQAYHTGRTVADNDFPHSAWQQLLPGGHVVLHNVLFAPLAIGEQVVGIMGLANKPGGFTSADMDLAGNFGELAALALHNARNVEQVQLRSRLMDAAEEQARLGAFECCCQTRSVICSDGLCRILGLPENITHLTLEDFLRCICPKDREEVHRSMDLTLQNREDLELEFRGNGAMNERIFHLQARSIKQGEKSLLVGACQDVSALRQLEERSMLTRKLDAVGQLAAGMAHEINTPLQYITGNLSFVDNALRELWERHPELSDPDTEHMRTETVESIRDCTEGVHRIENIINSLTRFTRSTSNGHVYADLPTLFKDVAVISRRALEGVALMRMKLPRALRPTGPLPAELSTCLLNLVLNAVDAIRDREGAGRGTITLGADQTPGGLHLWVRDTGTGVSEDIRQRIFDPFFTTRDPGQGTGMGLAVVYAAIRRLGGDIWFDTNPGEGSTFHLTLPAHPETLS